MGSYLSIPGENGDYASTPDQTYHPVGDIDLRLDVALDVWATSGGFMFSKWSTSKAWHFQRPSIGNRIQLGISTDGDAGLWNDTNDTDIDTIVPDGAFIQLRITRVASSGLISYYYKTGGDPASASGWTADGTANAGSGNLFDGIQPIEVGSAWDGGAGAVGKYHRAIVMDGIDGTIVFDARFIDEDPGTTSFTESSSNAKTVTVNQVGDPQAEILSVSPPALRGTVIRSKKLYASIRM